MGRGQAQLGKSLKGKSKSDRRRQQSRSDAANDPHASLLADVKALEELDRLAQITEFHRKRLRAMALQEAVYSANNKRILVTFYRQLLRDEKVSELKGDMVTLAQSFTRDLLRKQSLVSKLASDITESSDLLLSVQRSHIAQVAQINKLNAETVLTVRHQYTAEIESLHAMHSAETQQLRQKFHYQREQLQSLIQQIEQEESHLRSEAKQAHETEREEIRNKNLELINELRINLENKIEELQRAFEEQHRYYVDTTEINNQNFNKLKDEDALLSLTIYEKKRKIKNLQSLFTSWKQKMELNDKEGRARNETLRKEKLLISGHCKDLKTKMRTFGLASEKSLVSLSASAHTALNKQRQQIALAETIIKKMELARKKETEKEKVLSFAPESFSSAVPSCEVAMTGFFNKYNKVKLDVEAIEIEKARLYRENWALKALLKQFLDGIAVTDTTINGPNPLLIVNDKNGKVLSSKVANTASKTVMGRIVRSGPPQLTQDATLIVHQVAMQSRAISQPVRAR